MVECNGFREAPMSKKKIVAGKTETWESTDLVAKLFIALLEQDIEHNPQAIKPLDIKLAQRLSGLTKGMDVSPEEDLGDAVLI